MENKYKSKRIASYMATYEEEASGIRIFPGCWRPHYPFEHIAWISPPWPSQDYLWYDFPEAIFSDIGLLYLSHVNPAFPSLFPRLQRIPWRKTDNGIYYERALPNGVSFGGRISKSGENRIATEIWIKNDSDVVLEKVKLQTCLFLRAIKEFSAYTGENKFVHVPEKGWLPYPRALAEKGRRGRFRLGWRGGPLIADLPVMVAASSKGERLVACTWFEDTYSLVNNPAHPCMHADPAVDRIGIGERALVSGEVWFFQGSLEEFTEESKEWLIVGPHLT